MNTGYFSNSKYNFILYSSEALQLFLLNLIWLYYIAPICFANFPFFCIPVAHPRNYAFTGFAVISTVLRQQLFNHIPKFYFGGRFIPQLYKLQHTFIHYFCFRNFIVKSFKPSGLHLMHQQPM